MPTFDIINSAVIFKGSNIRIEECIKAFKMCLSDNVGTALQLLGTNFNVFSHCCVEGEYYAYFEPKERRRVRVMYHEGYFLLRSLGLETDTLTIAPYWLLSELVLSLYVDNHNEPLVLLGSKKQTNYKNNNLDSLLPVLTIESKEQERVYYWIRHGFSGYNDYFYRLSGYDHLNFRYDTVITLPDIT